MCFPRLKSLMKVHKADMEAVSRTHNKHLAQSQRKHLQALYNNSRNRHMKWSSVPQAIIPECCKEESAQHDTQCVG